MFYYNDQKGHCRRLEYVWVCVREKETEREWGYIWKSVSLLGVKKNIIHPLTKCLIQQIFIF